MNARFYIACAISGCFWAVIAWLLGRLALGPIIWGGLLAAPAIGLVGGVAYRPAYRLPPVGRAVAALVSLYLATVLFGLAIGLYDLSRDIGPRIAYAVVVQSVLGCLWGVTLTGYVAFLWPLAYLNHALVGRLAGR